MPQRPRSPCTVPRCPRLVARPGACEEHRRERDRLRQARASHRAVYRDPRWPALSARVLAEQPRCRICGAPSTDVDHVRPLRTGGDPFDRANLQALCGPCHSRKTARETGFGGAHT